MKNLILNLKTNFSLLSLLVGIFITPPIILKTKILPSSPFLHFGVLTACTVICLCIMYLEKWDWVNKKKKLKEMVLPYVLFTILGIVFLIIMAKLFDFRIDKNWAQKIDMRYSLIPVLCLLQVIGYQEFLPKKLSIFIKNKNLLALANGIIFAIMHIMFKPEFVFISFVGGVSFTKVYQSNRSLTLMTGSHTILNITAGFLGAFNF